MAHILLPTDFSGNALNAAKYAAMLFGTEGNTFTVLNSFMAPHAGASVLMSLDDILGRESREGVEEFAKRLQEDMDLSKSTVEVISEHGDLPGVIARLQEDDPSIDAVVMGTQGATGLKEVLMGSNTADVVRRSTKAVLAVPEKAEHQLPKRILVADDGGRVDRATVQVMLDIARKGNAEIHLVRVKTDEERTGSHYPELLDGISFRTFEIEGEDVESALNDQVKVSDADLVVMLRRKLGLFEGIFHRSASKRMVMHTHIPLLVLQQ